MDAVFREIREIREHPGLRGWTSSRLRLQILDFSLCRVFVIIPTISSPPQKPTCSLACHLATKLDHYTAAHSSSYTFARDTSSPFRCPSPSRVHQNPLSPPRINNPPHPNDSCPKLTRSTLLALGYPFLTLLLSQRACEAPLSLTRRRHVGRSVAVPPRGADKRRKPVFTGFLHHHVQRSGMVWIILTISRRLS